jgi:ATP-binding cassette subfamily F protein 3
VNALEPSAGSFEWGHNVQWGHYSQDPLKALKQSTDNLLDWLWQKMADQSETVVRSLLGQMLFSSDDVKKKVKRVSGGEAARLQFAWLTQKRPNLLLLDEPTNHLDMEAIEALEGALSNYDGSIIFVSHHRHFLSALATEVLELKWDGAFHYPGDYDGFTQATQRDYLAARKRPKSPKKGSDKPASPKASSSKRPPNVQKLKKDQKTLTRQIEQIENRLKEIQDLYLSPDFHKSAAGEEMHTLSEEESKLNKDLEDKMLNWERVSSLLEEHYPNH